MASGAQSKQALVLFKSLAGSSDIHPDRRLTLNRDRPIVTIGRSSKRKAELEASAANAYFDCPVMSREHAELHLDIEKHAITIQDVGSLHGTLLNKLALRPTEARTIRTGDIISFGLPIDRGNDKFTPLEVEAKITWEAQGPTSSAVTYSVPDDTDVDEFSDKEDSLPEMVFAKRILAENNYRPVDYKGSSIDLTSPVLPPISSFDAPSKPSAVVDLTLDAAGAERYREKPAAKSWREPRDITLLPILNTPQANDGHVASDDHSNEDDERSWDTHSDDITRLEPLSDISDQEEGIDLNLMEVYNSDDEADDLWGDDDDGMDELTTVDVVSAAIAHDSETRHEVNEQSKAPESQHSAIQTVDKEKPVSPPSLAPADFAFNPDVPKLSPGFSQQVHKPLSAVDKSAFWSAREQNRKTLGLPTKSGHMRCNSGSDETRQRRQTPDFSLGNGSNVDVTNELLRSGYEFLNEPLKDYKGNEQILVSESPALDESSAYRFEMSKKAIQAAESKEHVQTEPSSEIEAVEQTKKPAPKRKADEISESSVEEAETETATKPEQVKQAVAQPHAAIAPTLAEPAVATLIGHSCNRDSNAALRPFTNSLERPAKRLRRAAEVVGYAAIGGIAVVSALIATAPQL